MDKKLQRQLQLAGIIKENKEQKLPFSLIREGNDGKTYAISKENSKYYIKTANTTENLQESDFDYLGGLANKSKNSYKSFESATFKLNLIFESNRTSGEDSIDLLTEKKFVLKQPKPKKKKVEPELDFGGDAEGDEGFDFGDDAEGDEGFDFGDDAEGDEESGVTGDNVKDIQSLTGKLGQKVRDTEDLSSDMQKWVAKSVLSALDMNTLDDSDKQDIINALGDGGIEESDEEDYNKYDEDLDTPRGGERYDRDELLFDADGYNGDGVDEVEEDDFILRASDLKRPSTDKGYFNEVHKPITEDHLDDEMGSYNQLQSYLDLEDTVRDYGFELGWCHKEDDKVYLDLLDGKEKLSKLTIDGDGNMEVGYMGKNGKFIGEPLDNSSDIDEFFGEFKDYDMMENQEAPVKTPTRTKPGTTPGRRDRTFKPPAPTEDPKPKAERGDSPAPAKPKTTPTTKPGKPSRRERPFNPPVPSEDPGPKASDEVDFGY